MSRLVHGVDVVELSIKCRDYVNRGVSAFGELYFSIE